MTDSLPSPPTPVEALQQAIAESSRALELVSITGHEFNVKFERLLLAALELALAYAELDQANGPTAELISAEQDAFSTLIEALQQ